MKRFLGALLLTALASGAPAFAQTPAAQDSPPAHQMRMMQLFTNLTGITQAQLQQIQTLIQQYQAAHPPGSAPDQAARQTLMNSVMNVLTPAQQTQLRNEIQQYRAAHQTETQPSPSPRP